MQRSQLNLDAIAEAASSRRLRLRPRRPSDAFALYSTMADPDMMRWWSRAPFERVEDLRASFSEGDTSDWRSWAVVRVGEEQAIGFVSTSQKREGVSEIGYLVAREAQGQGYAYEAVAMLVDQLFALGQRRVFADTDPDNKPSIALLRALGFTLEGRLRAEWRTHIGVRDSLIYGVLSSEWRENLN